MPDSVGEETPGCPASATSPRSSTVRSSPPATRVARWIRFSSSRTLPDQSWRRRAPSAAEENLLALLGCEVAVVCGTTGWTPGPGLREALDGAAAGVVVAANFSIGMNLFCRVVTQAGRLYGAIGSHDPFVLEAHHRGKRDTPSGTARQLARLLVEADPRLDSIHEGNPSCPLPANVLQVASLRAGSEFGSHTVGFDGEHDRVVLRHDARGRAGFALGAVLAAEWLSGRSGAHDFDEVVDSLIGQGGIG